MPDEDGRRLTALSHSDHGIAEEEVLRANLYACWRIFSSGRPDRRISTCSPPCRAMKPPFGQAVARLARNAGVAEPEDPEREYTTCSSVCGRGELIPYGSYYLTGFLNEKPLARLRSDMPASASSAAQRCASPRTTSRRNAR